MLHAILFFSLGVTALCCYTLYIISKERTALSSNTYVTLYQTDRNALKKPLKAASRPSPFKAQRRPLKKRPVIEILDKADNFYPVMPKGMLDMRV